MADWRQYISVMNMVDPTIALGFVNFQITTQDGYPNVSFTFSASAASGMCENDLAQSIVDSLNFTLATTFVSTQDPSNPQQPTTIPLLYGGYPAFSSMIPPPCFAAYITDNIVSIWSQCRFNVRILSNTGNNIVSVNPNPIYTTLADAKDMATVMGIDFEDNSENPLTDQQLTILLRNASAQLIALLRNPIVINNYLERFIGNTTGSIFLKYKPCMNYDLPNIRRPYIIGVTTVLITKSPVSYDWDPTTGLFSYRFTNDLIEIAEPFDQGNEIVMTYRAGYQNVPSIIKEKTIEVAQDIMLNPNIKSLRGGTGQVEYNDPISNLRWMAIQLGEFRIV